MIAKHFILREILSYPGSTFIDCTSNFILFYQNLVNFDVCSMQGLWLRDPTQQKHEITMFGHFLNHLCIFVFIFLFGTKLFYLKLYFDKLQSKSYLVAKILRRSDENKISLRRLKTIGMGPEKLYRFWEKINIFKQACDILLFRIVFTFRKDEKLSII